MKFSVFFSNLFQNKIFALILLILCTAFIFSNSLTSAEQSSSQSAVVVDRVVEILNEVGVKANEETVVKVIRKTAHFSEFFALGAVCYYFRYLISKHPYKLSVNFILYGVITALTDETLQYTSLGRSPEILDVWIDVSGFLVSFSAMLFVFTFIYFKLNSNNKLKDSQQF